MGCGCLIVLASALSPRFALFLVWLFTDRVPAAYDGSWIVGILGFFLLPWTTLAWTLVWAPHGGVSGLGWFIVILGFCVDMSTHLGAARTERDRRASLAT
ncbi:MAG: hypothetical protein JST64_06875 [Actinobacteria bacterium]|nr:hypothetical protein [Actinomycetota bacterium]